MRIVDGFRLREVAGEMVVFGESVAQVDYSKVITFNNSAALLWRAVEGREFTTDDLVEILMQEYEVTQDIAAEDAQKITDSWLQLGLVEK